MPWVLDSCLDQTSCLGWTDLPLARVLPLDLISRCLISLGRNISVLRVCGLMDGSNLSYFCVEHGLRSTCGSIALIPCGFNQCFKFHTVFTGIASIYRTGV